MTGQVPAFTQSHVTMITADTKKPPLPGNNVQHMCADVSRLSPVSLNVHIADDENGTDPPHHASSENCHTDKKRPEASMWFLKNNSAVFRLEINLYRDQKYGLHAEVHHSSLTKLPE